MLIEIGLALCVGILGAVALRQKRDIANLQNDCAEMYKHTNSAISEVEEMRWIQNEFWFFLNSNYFDHLQHLRSHYHIIENSKGKLAPSKPNWSPGEELKVIELGKWVTAEAKKRGLPVRQMQPKGMD